MGSRLDFGLFIPPIHHPSQNPTLTIRQDLDLISLAEKHGYAEAWIGEHHSGGYEIIGSNEIFIAAAAERTSTIRLGTGVVSLPYHHPYMVAERAVLLDHLSGGRTMMGFGPGALPGDARMLGIDFAVQRDRMNEAAEVIDQLLTSPAPVTRESEWFTLIDGWLQVKPVARTGIDTVVACLESPAGPRLAGRLGHGLLSFGATTEKGFEAMKGHWAIVEEEAARSGRPNSRSKWRITAPVYVAETREQAVEEARWGLPRFMDYASRVSGRTLGPEEEYKTDAPAPEEQDIQVLVDGFNASGAGLIGTPADAVAFLERLDRQSGGFGVFLNMMIDAFRPTALHRSLELLALEVLPVFQDSLASMVRARETAIAERPQLSRENRAAINEYMSRR